MANKAPTSGKAPTPGKALWRRAFDTVEHAVAPPLERFVQTSTFADVSALGVRLQAGIRRRAEHRTAQLWHLANLPAAGDVYRLREQVAALDRQLRTLVVAADETKRESRDGSVTHLADTAGRRGTGAAGGRAQRPARPKRDQAGGGPRPAGGRPDA